MLLCWTQKPRKAAAPAGCSAALRLSVPTPEPGRKGWADSRGKRNVKVPLLLPLTPNKLTTGKLKAQCALHDSAGRHLVSVHRGGSPQADPLGFALADCLPMSGVSWGGCQLWRGKHWSEQWHPPGKQGALQKRNLVSVSLRGLWSGHKRSTFISKKSLSASSLEAVTPWALAGGWRFQKVNSGLTSEHTVPVPGWATDLWTRVCRVNQVALNSPHCLWDHSFL